MNEPTAAAGSPSGVSVAWEERRGWSRLGIASLVVGALSAFTFVAAIVLALVWKIESGPGGPENDRVHKMVVGFIGIGALLGLAVGAALAIGGLFEARRTRGPAILGLIFNGLGVLLFALVILIGVIARR